MRIHDGMIRDFRVHGGKHCETTAANHVLRHAGIDLSENLLLGLGGGIGFIYWYMKRMPAPLVGGRAGGRNLNLVANILRRVGGEAEVLQTASAGRAEAWLREELGAARPVVCWGDMAYLPYFGVGPDDHFGGHVFVVYGIDDEGDVVWIADRGQNPYRISREELAAARGSTHQPFPPRNMMIRARPPAKVANLEPGVLAAIRECAAGLGEAPIVNVGVRGFGKWAEEVRRWPREFPGARLVDCLTSVYLYIEVGGTGGSAFRPMYAGFLEQAADITGKAALRDAAGAYLEAGRAWSEIAAAALPEEVRPLAGIRAALDARNRAMERNENGALAKAKEAARALSRLRAQAAAALAPAGAQPLVEDLSARILRLQVMEKRAHELLVAAVG